MWTMNQISAGTDLLDFADDTSFATILADPPWRFTNRTGKMAPEHRRLSRYATMTLDDILELLPQRDRARSLRYARQERADAAAGAQDAQPVGDPEARAQPQTGRALRHYRVL